ncbi:MAG: DNA polymerase III subunit gamma/tau [Candidatus Auribacter fodinae]|uniref:DNA polymerase III subunit gamma/tau n=1 Tax=Candidatus Auribacter fodinae TaxID=2093366 RepID=A0A3A4RBD9_9BACT|nr:MAG: DNA polymerase III subunit gamma/tau [Candidatus Auribacter fodinae]
MHAVHIYQEYMDTDYVNSEFVVTARKWRPQSFDTVVGQEHIATTLKNAIARNRIAHAYLFTGSRGVGKTSTARIFARALNCEQGPTVNPCGTCEMCTEIIQGSSMDVIEIDGASNNKVDEVRELRDSVKFVPAKGKYKIYIIDEVHMLTTSAFNALLKTLEEPPPHVIFIFATTEPQKVLPTILSRCQRFDFHRIPQCIIRDHLANISKTEGYSIEPGVLDAIARAGDGSMRDAQSMFDQVVAFCGTTITFEQISSILGIYHTDVFYLLTEHAHNQNIADGIMLIGRILRDGKNLSHFFDGLLQHFRSLLLVSLLENRTDVLETTPEEIQRLRAQASWFTPNELEYAVGLIAQAGVDIRYALSKQVALELLFLKLSRIHSVISIDQALLKLEEIQQGTPGTKPAPATPNAEPVRKVAENKPESTVQISTQQVVKPVVFPAEAPKEKPLPTLSPRQINTPAPAQRPASFNDTNTLKVDLATIQSSWKKVCDSCENNMLHNNLVNARVVSYDGEILTLGAAGALFLDMLRDKKQQIESLLANYFKTVIRIKVILDDKKPEPPSAATVIEPGVAAAQDTTSGRMRREDEILNDPKVQKLVESFEGKVLSVRRKQ